MKIINTEETQTKERKKICFKLNDALCAFF